ncbi:MAG: integrase [Candidatus Pacebacteria bacterium CG10_big_fil_rev_8_21_14_0_10_40_26]|nr:MAG: integrase [Candidatus Pacebacteria bacterium CG10_big_fil_rev_8_21_14_0_10_40_26]
MNTETLIDEMKLRNFSEKTVKAYLYYNNIFLKFIDKNPKEVSGKDIKLYLLYLIKRNKSSSTINLAHNALAFYYGKVLRKNMKEVPFQKREQKEREVPTQDEIIKLLEVTKNLKHRLMISLLYASGVRVSELVNIKQDHIDFERKLLTIKQGKGNKDRMTILSDLVIFEMKNYLRTRPYHNDYVFASHDGHITTRTVEEVINAARRKAGITKNITPHSLRHSFATHHMESGTRAEYIQKMLGHKDIRTTKIYERVSTKLLEGIKSPHDKMKVRA